MPESKSLQEKGSKLPAVVPASRTRSASASKRTGILGALAVFAPLAVEVVYGLTRKWLSETTTSKPISETTDKRETMKNWIASCLGQPDVVTVIGGAKTESKYKANRFKEKKHESSNFCRGSHA